MAQSSGSIHAAVGSSGDVYIVGPPEAFPWPQPTSTIGDTSSQEFFVAKLDASGNPLYATAIGGAVYGSLVLDSVGDLYAYGGGADAKAFTTTPGASNSSASVSSGDYVCKLRAADGSILFCSFPGSRGSVGGGLATDPMGNVYFAEVPAFSLYPNPTPGALALGTRYVQVTKLDPKGAVAYRAEFSGPQGSASPASIAADAQGNVWVAGYADADFPTTPNAVLSIASQMPAGFVAELNPSGSALVYSTFTDGSGFNTQIALDNVGNVYEAERATAGGGTILRKYRSGGTSMSYEQEVAGGGLSFSVDVAGNLTALGRTTLVNFPTYRPVAACGPPDPIGDWILVRVDPAGELLESTFLSIPLPYSSFPQMGSNGYFLVTSTPTANFAVGPFQLQVGQLGPTTASTVNLACVGNAASFTLAALAPGEIVSLFGNGLGPSTPVSAQFANNRLPFNLAGTQVTFNGIPAQLLYTSDSQMNAIAPFGIQGAPAVKVCVAFQGNSTNCMTMNVADTAPGIFQLPSGYAAAVNQDGTINGPQNPAAMGSVVSLYVTGLGPLGPTPADGSTVGFPLPTLTHGVQVAFSVAGRFGTVPGDVLYAGPAPLEIAGLYQINVMIPVTPVQLVSVAMGTYVGPGMFVPTSQFQPVAIHSVNAGNGALP